MLPVSGAHLRLTCQPGKEGTAYVFRYAAENVAQLPLLVMDAMPRVDPATRKVSANADASPVLLLEDGSVLIGKYIAPLPQDRAVMAPDLPLCVRLEPGQTIERVLRLPLPFAETSPYFHDLGLRDYEPVEAKGVVLAIGYWPAEAPGIYAAACAYSPEHLVVAVTLAPVLARLGWLAIPAKKLEILRRKDAFPRVLKSHGNP